MNKKNLDKWNEWFAGLTDGDGCFYINKNEKSISFELTTHITDSRIVRNIKNILKGGSVKLRSHSNSIRYRVKKKSVIIDIVNRLNGKLYNPARVEQFQKVCQLLNISFTVGPTLVDKKNSYLAGLIDSDGTLSISISNSSSENSQKSGLEGKLLRLIHSKSHNQMYLKISSQYKEQVLFIQNSYGFGNIYEEKINKINKKPKPIYHWTIRSYDDFLAMSNYLKTNPLKSIKMHRARLSLLYFKYRELKYPLKESQTIEFKIWNKFCHSWFKYFV